MLLVKNSVIRWTSQTEDRLERIIWINSDCSNLVVFDLNAKRFSTTWRTCDEVLAAIEIKNAIILDEDPFVRLFPSLDELPEKYQELGNIAWKTIQPILESGTDVFIPQKRGKLVREAHIRTGHSRRSIYEWLTKYFRYGMIKDAVFPLYENCGGKGKEKKAGTTKRGRPETTSNGKTVRYGNVTPDMKTKIQNGVDAFYANKDRHSITKAYYLTIAEFFSQGEEVRGDTRGPVPLPLDQIPSPTQFRYWGFKDRSFTQIVKKRKGDHAFNTRYRAATGDATALSFGPGHIVELDSTESDVYLVHPFDRRWIIYCGTSYTLKDVFSRCIVGLVIDLRSPCYELGLVGIENMLTNKVELCARYGISIKEEEWPCHHLPEIIVADGGEFAGDNGDQLVTELNIRVDITASLRPDQKPIVERDFALANQQLIHDLPGARLKSREKDEPDPRLSACLTLEEFTRLMIRRIIYYNNHHQLTGYPFSKDMLETGIDPNPTPIILWNWGMKYRAGHLRTISPKVARLKLLPRAEASVTDRGIFFQNKYYTCETAVREEWFEQARTKGRRSITIRYRTYPVSNIYYVDDSNNMEECTLCDNSDAYEHLHLSEFEAFWHYKNSKSKESEYDRLKAKVDYVNDVKTVVENAKEATKEARRGTSRKKLLEGIAEHSRDAQKIYQQLDALRELVDQTGTKTVKGIEVKDNLGAYPSMVEELSKLLEEEINEAD